MLYSPISPDVTNRCPWLMTNVWLILNDKPLFGKQLHVFQLNTSYLTEPYIALHPEQIKHGSFGNIFLVTVPM